MNKETTEDSSRHKQLEHLSIGELLSRINEEDVSVALAVRNSLDAIEKLAIATHQKLENGGRLFYLGAGTSGRLGILDSSECPPTYGVPSNMVIGIIAGGDGAIRKAVEGAEDNEQQAFKDLEAFEVGPADMVVGITASGRTPYVLGGLRDCQKAGITTGSISCNPNSEVAVIAQFPVVVQTGAEFVSGSTRMKAGTAQKMVLNMLTTSVMIRLGRVKGNAMVDMQLSNQKLVDRGSRIIMQWLSLDYDSARKQLLLHGSVRKVLELNGKA